jgi:quinol monooxygenase YgiN
MNSIECSVSLHPYFKVHPGKLDAAKVLLREFVAKTSTEEKALYYEFTLNGDEIFCREAYVDADGVLMHLTSVGALLEKMLSISALARLEVHGPPTELEKLKGPLGGLKPSWFIYECGLKR